MSTGTVHKPGCVCDKCEAVADYRRINALQDYVWRRGALVIHTGHAETGRLPGLAFGGDNVGCRSLRAALDQLRRDPPKSSKQPAAVMVSMCGANPSSETLAALNDIAKAARAYLAMIAQQDQMRERAQQASDLARKVARPGGRKKVQP